MGRINRTAGCALAFLLLSLSALTPAMAQTPRHEYGFCQGLAGNPRVNNFTRVFVLGPTSGSAPMSTFISYLHKKYGGYVTQEIGCRTFATAAEAEAGYRKELADSAPYAGTWPIVEVDWLPEGGSALSDGAVAPAPAPAAAAPKPKAPETVAVAAPAAAPKPATAAVVAPKPATAAAVTPPKPAPAPVAAKPAPAAPATPAPPASKPGVYVICRSEWNTDMRRFYNPPVDGRGAGYAEWQASYRDYLVKRHKYNGSNSGCGKYPTREAAQKDFESWVVTARQQPTVNGLNSPIIITNWKY